MHLGTSRGENKRGDGIGSQHRGGKGHEREVRHRGRTIHQGIMKEIGPHAAHHQPPAFLTQAVAAGQGIYFLGMARNLDHGGRGAGHDLIRPLVLGFAHRSGRGARRSAGRRAAGRLFAGGLLTFRLFGRRQVPRGACGAGGLGGVVESAHIIPAYAVKNLFQEVTLSRDYTGEA